VNSEGMYVITTAYHVHVKTFVILIAVFTTDGHYFTSLASWKHSTPSQLTSPKLTAADHSPLSSAVAMEE